MQPPPPRYTSFPIKGESLSYPPESENLVSTPTSSPRPILLAGLAGFNSIIERKDGLIHLHLNFMERDFSQSSVMERGPSNASEGVYLSRGGWFRSSIWLLYPGCPGIDWKGCGLFLNSFPGTGEKANPFIRLKWIIATENGRVGTLCSAPIVLPLLKSDQVIEEVATTRGGKGMGGETNERRWNLFFVWWRLIVDRMKALLLLRWGYGLIQY